MESTIQLFFVLAVFFFMESRPSRSTPDNIFGDVLKPGTLERFEPGFASTPVMSLLVYKSMMEIDI